jgi:hypothetical protein
MSDYDRRPENRNQPDRRRLNRDRPSGDYDDDREVDDLRIPDLRRRSSHYGHSQDWEQRLDNQATDDGMMGMSSLSGCIKGANVRWLFIGLLVLAAMRGGSSKSGCMPSRGCINTFLLNIAGIALMIGGVYVYDSDGNGNIAGALGGIGGLACLVGTGGVFFLIWATLRMIDLNPFDDDGGDDDDGPLGMIGNFLGGR